MLVSPPPVCPVPALMTQRQEQLLGVSQQLTCDRSTAVPSLADIVCSAGSHLQCHVRRHCHGRNKAKLGCYAILHATFADYIRLNISHHHYRSLFFLWIFYDVWKHQSCGMKCCVFLIFLMTVALCYTEGATQQNTNYRLPTEQRWTDAGMQ